MSQWKTEAEIRRISVSSESIRKKLKRTGQDMLILITVNHIFYINECKMAFEDFYKGFLVSAWLDR